MRKFAVLVLLGLLSACSSGGGNNAQSTASPAASPMASAQNAANAHPVLLRPSRMTLQAARAACGPDSLGSITFSMGHARAQASPGVDLRERPEEPSALTEILFRDRTSGKSATVIANGHNRSVSGKNVVPKAHRSVACIQPD